MSRVLVGLLGLFAAVLQASADPSIVLRHPAWSQVRLSPDGEHLSALARGADGARTVIVADTELERRREVARFPDNAIRQVYWATGERLLLLVGEAGQAPTLHAVNRDGGGYTELLPSLGAASAHRGVRVIDLLGPYPTRVLISLDATEPWQASVYRLNIFDGDLQRVAANPGGVYRWLTGRGGQPRLQLRWAPRLSGVARELWYRSGAGASWRRLTRFGLGEPGLEPLGFTPDNRHLWVATGRRGDTVGVYRYDADSQKLGEALFVHPERDVMTLRRHPMRVAFQGRRVQQVFLEPRWQRLQRRIDGDFGDRDVRIESVNAKAGLAVVLAASDRDPGSYYLVDTDTLERRQLGRRRPGVDPRAMARVRPVAYETRDGLAIEGYLTLPAERAQPAPERPPRRPPLVVLPHGGPWSRVDQGFDPTVQFLVARGFAVLQMNYRGSSGYGRRFLNAGIGQWGRAMQDDIADGVRWVVERGHVDDERVAIMGASYGGYAALMGLVRQPALYRCAVAHVPVTDLAAHIRRFRKLDHQRAFHEWIAMVGDPRAANHRLDAVSPLHRVDDIDAPALIAHGARDGRVDPRQSRRLAAALAAADKPHKLLMYDRAGHKLRREVDRIDFHRRAADFLAGCMD